MASFAEDGDKGERIGVGGESESDSCSGCGLSDGSGGIGVVEECGEARGTAEDDEDDVGMTTRSVTGISFAPHELLQARPSAFSSASSSYADSCM